MAVQNKVPLAKQFAEFRLAGEAIAQFGLDPNEFWDWLNPLLNEWIQEKTMPKKVVKVDLTQDTTALITEWKAASDQLELVKSKESQLRVALVNKLFTNEKFEGTESVDIGYGFRLKSTKSMNYTATDESQQTQALLQAVAQVDPAMPGALVKWKPELSTKIVRDLIKLAEEHPHIKTLMAAAITVKPGMPQLEMVPPKAEEPAPVLQTGFTHTDGSNIEF